MTVPTNIVLVITPTVESAITAHFSCRNTSILMWIAPAKSRKPSMLFISNRERSRCSTRPRISPSRCGMALPTATSSTENSSAKNMRPMEEGSFNTRKFT